MAINKITMLEQYNDAGPFFVFFFLPGNNHVGIGMEYEDYVC